MKKILLILFLTLTLISKENSNTKEFDIDKEIEKIMKAPPSKRRELMNALKRKIFELNLDIQSSQILNLQKILGLHRHKGKH